MNYKEWSRTPAGIESKRKRNQRYSSSHKKQIKKQKAAWRTANPDKVKVGHQRYQIRRHGITLERYDTMVSDQGNVCALCEQPFTKNDKASIDHDHTCCPGQFGCDNCVRAVIHQKCNRAIGQLNDNPELVLKAYQYLMKYKENSMSSFRQQHTEINDERCLEDALKQLGYKPSVTAEKQKVRGHYNESRKAEIVLKKEDLSQGGDIGFEKDSKGNFTIVTDTYVMKNGFDLAKFTKEVKLKYAEVKIRRQAAKAGLTFVRKVDNNNGGYKMQFVKA